MKINTSLFLFLLSSFTIHSQINPDAVEIVRDSYGVPHIYASTDAEVAYGFAWAQAEDDFETIQQAYLAGNGLLSKHIGLKGAAADFLVQFIQSEQTVNEQFHTLDTKFIELLNGFTEGMWEACEQVSMGPKGTIQGAHELRSTLMSLS